MDVPLLLWSECPHKWHFPPCFGAIIEGAASEAFVFEVPCNSLSLSLSISFSLSFFQEGRSKGSTLAPARPRPPNVVGKPSEKARRGRPDAREEIQCNKTGQRGLVISVKLQFQHLDCILMLTCRDLSFSLSLFLPSFHWGQVSERTRA